MTTVGLFVRLKAKEGKEQEVQRFLESGRTLVEAEPATTAWFAIKLGPSEFGIFDAFPDDAGRQAPSPGASPRRSWPRPTTCSPNLRTSSRSTCSLRSSLADRASSTT